MIEFWENADKFDVIRDKSNNNFEQIGKIAREEDGNLDYISNLLKPGPGVSVSHTNPDGNIYVGINGINSGAARQYMRVHPDGDKVQYVSFDIQGANGDQGGALLPASGGSVIVGPLTAGPGVNRRYILTAEIQLTHVSTNPSHEAQILYNGNPISSIIYQALVDESKQVVFSGLADNVAPGSQFSLRIVPIGTTNQYRYWRCRLTMMGFPV